MSELRTPEPGQEIIAHISREPLTLLEHFQQSGAQFEWSIAQNTHRKVGDEREMPEIIGEDTDMLIHRMSNTAATYAMHLARLGEVEGRSDEGYPTSKRMSIYTLGMAIEMGPELDSIDPESAQAVN